MTGINFIANNYNSPSPAYIRLTDISDLAGWTSATEYTRIWSVYNTTSLETIFVTTSATFIDIVLEGLEGTIFDIGLSAVY